MKDIIKTMLDQYRTSGKLFTQESYEQFTNTTLFQSDFGALKVGLEEKDSKFMSSEDFSQFMRDQIAQVNKKPASDTVLDETVIKTASASEPADTAIKPAASQGYMKCALGALTVAAVAYGLYYYGASMVGSAVSAYPQVQEALTNTTQYFGSYIPSVQLDYNLTNVFSQLSSVANTTSLGADISDFVATYTSGLSNSTLTAIRNAGDMDIQSMIDAEYLPNLNQEIRTYFVNKGYSDYLIASISSVLIYFVVKNLTQSMSNDRPVEKEMSPSESVEKETSRPKKQVKSAEVKFADHNEEITIPEINEALGRYESPESDAGAESSANVGDVLKGKDPETPLSHASVGDDVKDKNEEKAEKPSSNWLSKRNLAIGGFAVASAIMLYLNPDLVQGAASKTHAAIETMLAGFTQSPMGNALVTSADAAKMVAEDAAKTALVVSDAPAQTLAQCNPSFLAGLLPLPVMGKNLVTAADGAKMVAEDALKTALVPSNVIPPFCTPQEAISGLGDWLKFALKGLSVVVGGAALVKGGPALHSMVMDSGSDKKLTPSGHFVSFEHDRSGDPTAVEALREQLPELDPNTFRVEHSGMLNDTAHLVAVHYEKTEGGDFVANEAERSQLDNDIVKGFARDKIRVDMQIASDASKDEIAYAAGYYGFQDAMDAMPTGKIKANGCEIKAFFEGMCAAVLDKEPDVAPHVALSKRITDYNALCEKFATEPKNRLAHVGSSPRNKSERPGAASPPSDGSPDPDPSIKPGKP